MSKRNLESPDTDTRVTKVNRTEVNGHSIKESIIMPTEVDPNLNQQPITVSLDTLKQVISQELNTQLTTVTTDIKDSFVKELDARFQNVVTKEQLKSVEQQLNDLKEECKQQRQQLIDRINTLERISREKNLVFSNVQISTNPIQMVRDICMGSLGVENVNISKVFKLKEDTSRNSSTLLAVFNEESTVNLLLRRASRLKGTRIGLSRDLPKEARDTKSLLLKLRREILKTDASNSLNIKVFNNKIVIDNTTLILTNDFFGNRNSNIDGKDFLKTQFNVDFDVVKHNFTNPSQ